MKPLLASTIFLILALPLHLSAIATPSTPQNPLEVCEGYVEFEFGYCGNHYVFITSITTGSLPDCGGCAVSWEGYLTDSPTPTNPPVGPVRPVGSLGGGPCFSAITNEMLCPPLLGSGLLLRFTIGCYSCPMY
jgi:hypothetical protein